MENNIPTRSTSFFPTRPLSDVLPVSTGKPTTSSCLRKRLSQPPISSAALTAAMSWSVRQSKSISSVGELAGGSLRRWWDWGIGWIMTRKPGFARDLEMNEEENAMLGFHSKGSLRHVFHKVRSEFRRFVQGGGRKNEMGFGYSSFSYKQNFDDGKN